MGILEISHDKDARIRTTLYDRIISRNPDGVNKIELVFIETFHAQQTFSVVIPYDVFLRFAQAYYNAELTLPPLKGGQSGYTLKTSRQ